MDLDRFKTKLSKHDKSNIIITDHAKIRAITREINLKDVIDNIINPDRLVYYKEIPSSNNAERKFECYFAYSKTYCHKYVLAINKKVVVITIISINRDWQKMIK